MAQSLSLCILSPVENILDIKSVDSVRVNLKGDSWLSVYPGHAPLLAEVLPGKLVYIKDETQTEITINSGIMKVAKNEVILFVNQKNTAVEMSDVGQMEKFDSLARKLMATLAHHKTNEVESEV